MRKGGTAVLSGGNADRLELPYLGLMQNSYVVRGARGSPRSTTRRLIRAVEAGRIDPAALITHRFALSEANEAKDVIWNRIGSPWFVAVNPAAS
jgi:threonine dehydrogenase-like Zn-dependent dehydrogenase